MQKVEKVRYPGYTASWGSTSGWFREPGGPFVAYVYTKPDADGMSLRYERFFDALASAESYVHAWLTLPWPHIPYLKGYQ